MPKENKNLSKVKQKREKRLNESPYNRSIRLESNRIRNQESRQVESSRHRSVRLSQNRKRISTTRNMDFTNLNLEAFNYNKIYDYRFVNIYIYSIYNYYFIFASTST